MTISAMKQALEALNIIKSSCSEGRMAHAENEAAIAEYILRQAIAEAEKQEPVAFRNTETGEFCTGGFLRKDWAKWQPLYTAPVNARPVVHAVRCTYPQCQATNGCVGACSKTAPVHDSDISQEPVDETAKDRHISYVCPNCHWSLDRLSKPDQEPDDDIYDIWVETGTCQENRQVAKNATTERGQVGTESGPSQDQVGTRIWVGLTEQDVHDAFQFTELVKQLSFDRERPEWCQNFAAYLEAKLKEKNA